MPLETIGSYAVAGSSGANARGARPVESTASNDVAGLVAFATRSSRGGDSGGNVIQIPSPSPNVAAYLSPFIRLDLQTRLAIVQFRDSDTGEVQQQYPSPRVVREYQQNLPEDSDLRSDTAGADLPKPEIRIIGSGQSQSNDTDSAPVSFGGQSSAGSAPTRPPQSATAAFTSALNVLTGGRELAIA